MSLPIPLTPLEQALSYGQAFQWTWVREFDAAAVTKPVLDSSFVETPQLEPHPLGSKPPPDEHGRPFRVLVSDSAVFAWGAGSDGDFDTADDEYGLSGSPYEFMPGALRAKYDAEAQELRVLLRQMAARERAAAPR